MSAEEWQKQIANLTPAQRVGIVAAVALSCFALYATKNHRDICGGPLDSPRHRTNCPLAFLNCAPSNDINESIATIADSIKDFDAAAWELPAMPRIPPMPLLPGFPPKLEFLLGCHTTKRSRFTPTDSRACSARSSGGARICWSARTWTGTRRRLLPRRCYGVPIMSESPRTTLRAAGARSARTRTSWSTAGCRIGRPITSSRARDMLLGP